MLKVKLLHPDAKLPTVSYAGGDLGYDLYLIEDVALPPGVQGEARTGLPSKEGPVSDLCSVIARRWPSRA